jgi:hypothetical protein
MMNALALIIFCEFLGRVCFAGAIRLDRQVSASFHHFNCNASGSGKVKSASLNHQFVIAMHSPSGVVETGLLLCPSGIKAAKPANSFEQATFSGPV